MADSFQAAPAGVTVTADQLLQLDLSPLQAWAALTPQALLQRAGELELQFSWPRAAEDLRELSEIPELRL